MYGNFKKTTAFLLASLMLAGIVSCGGSGDTPSTDDSSSPSDSTTESAKVGYQYYEGVDFGGKVFNVYNVPRIHWDEICYLTVDEQNGETINDAVYNRNTKVFDTLNCSINEINCNSFGNMSTDVRTLALSGDDAIHAAYMPMYQLSSGLSEGLYLNLRDVDTIKLDEAYWDQSVLSSTAINGKNYFATNDAHLMSQESLWTMFFNKDMMDDLGLEYPYGLVRDGKWTLDKLAEYSKAAANLNGDDKFLYNPNGSAVFGTVSFYNVYMQFMHAFGTDYVKLDNSGKPSFNADSEAFITAAQKLADYVSTEGAWLTASATASDDDHFQKVFKAERAMFVLDGLCFAQLLRSFEFEFGALPMPKLDEKQEAYHSTPIHQVAVFTIPTTNTKPEEVGLLFDALSYESTEMVLAPYYSYLVEQKGMRDEESIEMLNIIKASKSIDIGVAYQWVADLEFAMRDQLLAGGDNIVSTVNTFKDSVEASIDNMMKYLG